MAISYFNSASTPADNGTSTGNVTVTPPGSMVTGDLVVVFCYYRGSSNITVGTTGGQTWTTAVTQSVATNPTLAYAAFWCTFNGTWSANPVFNFSTSSTNTNAIMHVFRPTNSVNTWAQEAAINVSDMPAPSSPFTCTTNFNGGGLGVGVELAGTTLFSDANLVSYYKLEDTSDSKGSNTLTNHNSISFNAALFNNGAALGTSNSSRYLDVASNLGIAGNGDITIIGWANWESAPSTYNSIFAHCSTLTQDRQLELYTNSASQHTIYAGGAQATATVVLNVGQWYNFALVRQSGVCSAYLNGNLIISGLSQGTTTKGLNSFTIGADADAASFCPCQFDDVAVFSRALTQTEIRTVATQGTTHSSAVQIGALISDDDNTWGSLTSGFTVLGSAQYRNTSGQDTSSSYGYKIFTSTGSLDPMSKNQATLGGDPYIGLGITLYEISNVVTIPNKIITLNQAVKRSNFY